MGKVFPYGTTSREEADLVGRLLRAQDEIVRLKPGFLEDAERFKELVSSFRGMTPERYLSKRPEAKKKIDAEWKSHARRAAAFAKKWDLPRPGPRHIDPSYLADRPYSGPITAYASIWAVMVRVGVPLPIIEFQVDVRHPSWLLRERLEQEIQKARRMWEKAGGWTYSVNERNVQRIENMLTIHRMRGEGKTYAKIAVRLKISEKQVYNLRMELADIVKSPSTLPAARFATRRWQDEEEVSRRGLAKGKYPMSRGVF